MEREGFEPSSLGCADERLSARSFRFRPGGYQTVTTHFQVTLRASDYRSCSLRWIQGLCFRVALWSSAPLLFSSLSYRSPLGVAVCGGRVVKSPPPLLKGYNVGGESQAQNRSYFRSSRTGRRPPEGYQTLERQGLVYQFGRGSQVVRASKLRKLTYLSYPNATGPPPPEDYRSLRYGGYAA